MNKRASKTSEPESGRARAEKQLRECRAHQADVETRLADAARTIEMAVDAAKPLRLAATQGDSIARERVAEADRVKGEAEATQRSLTAELEKAKEAIRVAEDLVEAAGAADRLEHAMALGAELVAEGEKIDRALGEIRDALARREQLAGRLAATNCFPTFLISSINDRSRLHGAITFAQATRYFRGYMGGISLGVTSLAAADQATLQRINIPRPRRPGERILFG
jgi:hypothetical protein